MLVTKIFLILPFCLHYFWSATIL